MLCCCGMNVTGGCCYSKKCPVEHLSCALLADADCDVFGINTLGSIANNSRKTEIEVWFLFDNLNREQKACFSQLFVQVLFEVHASYYIPQRACTARVKQCLQSVCLSISKMKNYQYSHIGTFL